MSIDVCLCLCLSCRVLFLLKMVLISACHDCDYSEAYSFSFFYLLELDRIVEKEAGRREGLVVNYAVVDQEGKKTTKKEKMYNERTLSISSLAGEVQAQDHPSGHEGRHPEGSQGLAVVMVGAETNFL